MIIHFRNIPLVASPTPNSLEMLGESEMISVCSERLGQPEDRLQTQGDWEKLEEMAQFLQGHSDVINPYW